MATEEVYDLSFFDNLMHKGADILQQYDTADSHVSHMNLF